MYSGLGTGNSTPGSLPNITGEVNYDGGQVGLTARGFSNGAFYGGSTCANTLNAGAVGSNTRAYIGFNAARVAGCYGRFNQDKVFPAHICMPFIIKY